MSTPDPRHCQYEWFLHSFDLSPGSSPSLEHDQCDHTVNGNKNEISSLFIAKIFLQLTNRHLHIVGVKNEIVPNGPRILRPR